MGLAKTDQDTRQVLDAFEGIVEAICQGISYHPTSLFEADREGYYCYLQSSLKSNNRNPHKNPRLGVGFMCALAGGKQLSSFVNPSDFVVKAINIEIK